MPFKPTLPIPTCETPIPPLPPGNPPNNCAECGDEIVTVQELLKLRWELDMNVDCYVPCDCELRCDTDCEEEGNGTTDPSGDIPTDNPSAAELNLPTYLVQIEDCDGDTSLVLADSLINVYGDYSMIGMIELSDDDNQEFRVETTTGDRTIGLDSLLNLIDNGEVIDVKTDNEGNCDECILDPPDCNPADQTAQSNYLSSLGSNPASLTYPTLLHRVRLCDGSEVYLFEEELNSLPGNYIILQTIQIENSSQILIQLLNDGCTTNWTVGGFQQVRTFNSDWNINHYIPCDQQDCSTLYDETINASSVSNSLNFETELNFYPTSSNLIQIYPGSSESLLIDGITWNISENVLGTGEVEYYINNGLSPNSTILDYEVKIVIPEASGYFTFYLALFDGVSFVPINGGQDYLYYPFLNYPNNSIPNEIILKPDALPTGMQASQMRLVFLKYSEGGVFKIDGISLDVKHIGTCDDVCNEQDPVCSTEELENQQASLDSIQTLWNETPLSDLELPTKLYRVKLCDGSEVYLLQHELSILEGNYLILQSIDINELSETHLFKKTGVDGEALDANDLFALKLKYYNGDQQINNTVGQGYGNGNIAAQYWQVAGRDRQAYGYRYDELDRVIFGKYADITENDEYYNKDHYSVDLFNAYDAIGNITRLSREGPISECIAPDSSILYSYGNIDRLQYLYNNDKTHLIGVNEYSISRGFKATTAYTYDDNGNLISDSGKGITEIKYNHLNLPYEVVFGNGNKIRWMYDATGKKLRKNVIGGGQTNQIDYIDGIEKDQINGDFVYHEEGRVYLTSVIDPVSSEVIIPSGTMAYTIKDHLGNARVTFADLDGNGWITIQDIASTPEEEPQELLQENHYYPFGMNMEGSWFPQVGESDKYQYNGIERNKDFGLDWDLAEFRSYDAAIGRWVQVDPLAELAYNWTPYRNAFNNPIKYIDPFGLFETKKEARQERRGQRRKARRNGEKWKGAKIKKNSEGRYDVRYKGSDGYVTRNESGDLEYGAVTRDPNAIRQYEPNFFERVENSGFWGNLLYSVANDASLTLQRFNPFDTQTTHLSNHIASKDEYTMGFVNTTMTAVPMARTQDAVIKVAHHGILRRLNAAQFSKFFKGTFLARMSPKMRGFINKQLNSKVIDKVATGNISYTTISISSTLVNKNSE
jgi:RHS repeat-associated protein